MKILIKTAGILFIVLSTSLFGFFKAFSKRKYIKRLLQTQAAFKNAGNLLRLGVDNRAKILSASFSTVEGFNITQAGVSFSDKYVADELSNAINTFLIEFGSGDTETERQRIERVVYSVETELTKETREYEKSHKVWQTLGVCAGLAIGIIFI